MGPGGAVVLTQPRGWLLIFSAIGVGVLRRAAHVHGIFRRAGRFRPAVKRAMVRLWRISTGFRQALA